MKIRKDQIEDIATGCIGFLVDVATYALYVVAVMWTLGILHRAGWTWLPALGLAHTSVVVGTICLVAFAARKWWEETK